MPSADGDIFRERAAAVIPAVSEGIIQQLRRNVGNALSCPLNSGFHRSSAELTRTNRAVCPSDAAVTISRLCWCRRHRSVLVCYSWRGHHVGIMNISFTSENHNNNTDDLKEARLHRSDGCLGSEVNAGVSGNKGHCGSSSLPLVDLAAGDHLLSALPRVTRGKGRLLLRPAEPNPKPPFGAPRQVVQLRLQHPDLETVGFLHEAALQAAPVIPYLRGRRGLGRIPARICRADRGKLTSTRD